MPVIGKNSRYAAVFMRAITKIRCLHLVFW